MRSWRGCGRGYSGLFRVFSTLQATPRATTTQRLANIVMAALAGWAFSQHNLEQ